MKFPQFNTKTLSIAVAALVASFLLAGAFARAQASNDDRQAQSLYKSARNALNAEEYREAAEKFREVYDRYPESKYAGDAMYWQAFALYRLGEKSDLRKAQRVLEVQLDKYSDTETREDASSLYYRILGKLASMGDAEAAERLAEDADTREKTDDWESDDTGIEEKLSALQALINMKSDKALPILEKLLSDPDPAKAELREKSLFLISQHGGDKAVDILVHVAKTDPDPDVREQAVFWLSQTRSDKAVEFLSELLNESGDPEIQEKAIFALSQTRDPRALAALKKAALDQNQPIHVREQAIFWLGQGGGSGELEFLKDLYGKLDEPELKEKVIFSVSQNSGGKGGDWLLGIVADEKESTDVRKQALFWAGQSRAIDLDGIVDIYQSAANRELREQAIFALSQRHEKKAIEIMIDLARKEKDPELRKKLIFWIGQSNDPAAEDFLLEIINE